MGDGLILAAHRLVDRAASVSDHDDDLSKSARAQIPLPERLEAAAELIHDALDEIANVRGECERRGVVDAEQCRELARIQDNLEYLVEDLHRWEMT